MRLTIPIVALATTTSLALGQVASSDSESGLRSSNESLLWGTYRPNLYFGLRARLPATLMTGLMWFGAQDYQGFSKMRHACDQGDGLVYTFTEHDGRNSAKEVIKDELNNVELTASFLKVPGEAAAGGSWAVRVEGKPLRRDQMSRISLINYFGNDGPLSSLELENSDEEEGLEGEITLRGSTHGLGDYAIRIVNHALNSEITPGSHSGDFPGYLERTHYFGAPIGPGQVWQAKNVFLNAITARYREVFPSYGQDKMLDPAVLLTLPDEARYGANLFGFQKVYEGTWTVDIFFELVTTPSQLDSKSLSTALGAASESFKSRFALAFPQISTFSSSQQSFARDILANLIGGVGYFHGSSIIDRTFSHEWDDEDSLASEGQKREPHPEMTEERELLTATPSRSFFPRGFYWDEGFHLLLVGAWDNDLSLEIIKSWINLVDEDGWVAREQILGEEARSKVPKEFQTQYPSYANPPTLTMGITAFIGRLRALGLTSLSSIVTDPDQEIFASSSTSALSLSSLHLSSPALAASYLTSLYPKLKLHYNWFRSTQRGQIREFGRKSRSSVEGYRWRGRTTDHVLTSGLDDYPRAIPPHLGELHVDLASWMAFFARTMKDVAEFLELEEDVEEFEDHYEDIVHNIDDLHWNEEKSMYCDASVDADDESYHVCHEGYISLFPLLLSLLEPSSPHLGPVLSLLRDPEQLWSPYGIRSLSKSHPLFGKGEDYWRGPIWIQMNYLALGALYNKYAKEPGPHQSLAGEIYSELRDNVINNVYKEYERTGFVWEQYDATTGEGRRSTPFTGWTSLVTLIMAEQYY
ncbi:mannosyl-oligosaccharide glucosidase [Sporobolomyces salmoneus]|uniref:mannosyl-oligosaccharide glucosidase n=1 Tax=Sporobolomyces salmoneus TaxID=183962 RepID=UPI0031721C26